LGASHGEVIAIVSGAVLIVMAFRRKPERPGPSTARDRVLSYFGLR
jgi:hypothetical protein